ncbi:unnamed protein product [Arctia plantaginis]|uniref:Uncharacterized protein n=1 Tax=Arctia plantaginis TaxID=874455 RepID=A0A8S0YMJ9_ARCPL|nr:unnamed protein product [Arctia plantaginis]
MSNKSYEVGDQPETVMVQCLWNKRRIIFVLLVEKSKINIISEGDPLIYFFKSARIIRCVGKTRVKKKVVRKKRLNTTVLNLLCVRGHLVH